MAEFLFCITSVLFLAWVMVLKLEIHSLKENIVNLEVKLQERFDEEKGDVEVTRDSEMR